MISKKYNLEEINNIYINDTKINCEDEILLNNIISECRLNNNINKLKDYIINYAKSKGIYNNLYKWRNKDNNILDERCKWFRCKYDVDNFLEKL